MNEKYKFEVEKYGSPPSPERSEIIHKQK